MRNKKVNGNNLILNILIDFITCNNHQNEFFLKHLNVLTFSYQL